MTWCFESFSRNIGKEGVRNEQSGTWKPIKVEVLEQASQDSRESCRGSP